MNQPVMLPHDVEAEMIALSCACMSPESTHKFCQSLTTKHFWFPHHQELCRAIHELHSHRREVDLVTLVSYLEKSGRMEDCGGRDEVVGVLSTGLLEARLTPAIQVVSELYAMRMIHQRAREVVQEVYNPNRSLAWKLEQAGSLTVGLVSGDTGATTAATVDLTPREMGEPTGLGYGLDYVTGGLTPGQLTVIQAKRKVGKTTTMVQMALADLCDGKAVCIVPVADMTASDISRKMIRQMCGWDKAPNQPAFDDAYQATVAEFRGFGDRLVIWDPNLSSGTSDIESITAWLDAQIHRRRPAKVYLDYFQRFTTRDSSDHSASTFAVIASKLGKWAHRYPDICTIVGSQETEDGRSAWTRELENEVALLLRMTKPEGSEARRVITVELNRFGAMGAQVSYDFDAKYLCFRPEDRARRSA